MSKQKPRRLVFSLLGVLAMVLSLLSPLAQVTKVSADHTSDPSSVAIAGSLQDELGCPGDWQPECANTDLSYDGDDDVDDTDTIQGGIVLGFKMSDMVSFEGGFGYRADDYDANGLREDSPKQWELYVQSNIQMAPGVWLQPEFGYADFDDDPTTTNNSEGSDWYLGAKWQMDF